jgi:hypothetical protein
MGSGGNFLRTMKVDPSGRVFPQGHLDLLPGDEPVKLYFWFLQFLPNGPNGDAAAAGFQDLEGLKESSTAWRARGDVVYDGGKFEAGVAIGTALLILREVGSNKTKARSWCETVRLE